MGSETAWLSPERPDGLFNLNYGDRCIAISLDRGSAEALMAVISEARRQGAEDMRERAAQVADAHNTTSSDGMTSMEILHNVGPLARSRTARDIADAIRALSA